MKLSLLPIRIALLWILCIYSCQKEDTFVAKPELLSFSFLQIPSAKINIDAGQQSVTVVLPYGTLINDLIPDLKVSEGVSIVPASGISQDFQRPVYYTLSSQTGTKVIYKVIVSTEQQASPEIVSLSTLEVEAGESLKVKGKHFGRFALGVKTYLLDSLSKSYLLSNQFQDSSELSIHIPYTQALGRYLVQVNVEGKSVVSKESIRVRYPRPQLKSLLSYHVLQGDSLKVSSLYTDTKKYRFTMVLRSGGNQHELLAETDSDGNLYGLPSRAVAAGDYELKLLNKTEQKESSWSTSKIRIYDASKPFISGIKSERVAYVSGDTLSFKTLNFKQLATRFYQVSLKSASQSYHINGLYHPTEGVLSVHLPANMKKGIYGVCVNFLDSTQGILYGIEIDKKINVLK